MLSLHLTGVAVAGLISNSNPEGSNWRLFQAAAPAGSWVMQLKRAGHTTFMQPPTLAETWLLDRVFGGGEVLIAVESRCCLDHDITDLLQQAMKSGTMTPCMLKLMTWQQPCYLTLTLSYVAQNFLGIMTSGHVIQPLPGLVNHVAQ